jgi:hypothetical protein
MEVKSGEQNRIAEDEMASKFLYILQDASDQPSAPLLSILTSEKRDTWAVIREKLREGETILYNSLLPFFSYISTILTCFLLTYLSYIQIRRTGRTWSSLRMRCW